MRGADVYNEALLTTVKLEDFVAARIPCDRSAPGQRCADRNGWQVLRDEMRLMTSAVDEHRPREAHASDAGALQHSRRAAAGRVQLQTTSLFAGLAVEDTVLNHSSSARTATG